ncbi:hypothetical protein JZ751_018468, partial [Albula glossodonta]
MENSTEAAVDTFLSVSLASFFNLTENDTSITPVTDSLHEDLASVGLRVTRDPVSLLASTLRTTGTGRLFEETLSSPAPGHLRVAFWDSPLSHGINVFVGVILCFTMLGLGCTVEVSQLGEHIRRPIGVLLALVCQFVIMPLVAFLLALMFSLNDVAAIAVLLCGCCPGGNLSNIMSLLVNGEMNLRCANGRERSPVMHSVRSLCLWETLFTGEERWRLWQSDSREEVTWKSIIMTISSTVLALVLMPLCLWIYSRAWINTPVVNLMPFGAIILTLCSTLIPIGLGVYLRYRYNRTADIILKTTARQSAGAQAVSLQGRRPQSVSLQGCSPSVCRGAAHRSAGAQTTARQSAGAQTTARQSAGVQTTARQSAGAQPVDLQGRRLQPVSLWSLLVTLVMLFIMTGAMLGPELLAAIPPSVYAVAVLMPMAGYAAGYGLATLFDLPPNSRRSVSLETGCQNVQLCTAILKLAFPPQLIGGLYMFPLLYALFQAAEAGIFILVYRLYRQEVLRKQDLLEEDDETNITYKTLKEEETGFDTAYGSVTVSDPNAIMLEPQVHPTQ